jgi:hypothetical protein
MEFPSECQWWIDLMDAGDDKERRIVENLRADPCIKPTIIDEFISRLLNGALPNTSEGACRKAYRVVKEDPDTFVCQGQEVPSTMFTVLFRIEDPDAMRYRIPDELDRLGFRDAVVLADLSDEDLRLLTDEYGGSVQLGNDLGIVWVTTMDEVVDLVPDMLGSLCNRLGLPWSAVVSRVVLCAYNRHETGRTLHVPRALDAVNRPEFEVEANCGANMGMTRPLAGSPDDGLVEAVHRSCSVVPSLWKLGIVT